MTKKILLLLLLACLLHCSAQIKPSAGIKSLLSTSQKTAKDSARVNTLNEIALRYYMVSNEVKHAKAVDSVAHYAQQALLMARELNYNNGIGKSYIMLSKAAMRAGNEAKSKSYANKAIELFSKTGNKNNLAAAYDALFEAGGMTNTPEVNLMLTEKVYQYYKEAGNKEEQAKALISMADWLMELGKMKEGQAKVYESIELNKKVGNRQNQMAYSLLSVSYYQLGETEKAVKYAIECTKLIEEFHDDSLDAADMYNYQVGIYDFLNDKQKAFECLQKAYKIALNYNNPALVTGIESNLVKALLKMDRKDDAIALLHVMEKKYHTLPKISQQLFVGRWTSTFVNIGDLKSAGRYINDAVAFSSKLPPFDYIQNAFYPSLLLYYYKTANYPEAKKFATLYKALGEKNGNKQSLAYAHGMLFKIDSVNQNFSTAILNLKKSQKYKDELLNETKNKQISEIEIRYETEKKDNENRLMKKQAELQQGKIAQLKTTKNISIMAIILLLIIAGLLYYNFLIKKRSNRLLQQQKGEIDHKNSTLQILLNEKEWLLKEIHHRVKNNLQIVMSLLNTQSRYLKDEAATTAIRNSQHRIHSMALIHKKLYQSDNVVAIDMSVYITELIEYLRVSFGIKKRIHFATDIDAVELDASQAVPLGLIINEVITNAIKYAFPNESEGTIAIKLKPTANNSYILSIKDNGIGLESGFDIKKSTTLGLRLIKGLSTELEAKLSIQNKNGLSIAIEFKLDEKIVLLKDISQEKLTA